MSRRVPRGGRPASVAVAILLPLAAAAPLGAQAVSAAARQTRAVASAPAREVVINRETFTYQGAGRRDPYASLMTSTDVRPLISDLRLTGVAYDPDGRNSVAILRDLQTRAQYRVSVGQHLGRLRVTAIGQRAVQFTIDEFGFSRTESIPLSRDSSTTRTP